MWRAAIWLFFNVMICIAFNCHKSWTESGPVCGDDTQTYPNLCALKMAEDVELAHHGFCPCSPGEDEWDPVCGSDGQSYANYCQLERSRVHWQDLRVAYRDICKEMVEKEVMSGSDYYKIEEWKKIMPEDLYIQLMSRNISLANGGTALSPYLIEKMEEDKARADLEKKKKRKKKVPSKLSDPKQNEVTKKLSVPQGSVLGPYLLKKAAEEKNSTEVQTGTTKLNPKTLQFVKKKLMIVPGIIKDDRK